MDRQIQADTWVEPKSYLYSVHFHFGHGAFTVIVHECCGIPSSVLCSCSWFSVVQFPPECTNFALKCQLSRPRWWRFPQKWHHRLITGYCRSTSMIVCILCPSNFLLTAPLFWQIPLRSSNSKSEFLRSSSVRVVWQTAAVSPFFIKNPRRICGVLSLFWLSELIFEHTSSIFEFYS